MTGIFGSILLELLFLMGDLKAGGGGLGGGELVRAVVESWFGDVASGSSSCAASVS